MIYQSKTQAHIARLIRCSEHFSKFWSTLTIDERSQFQSLAEDFETSPAEFCKMSKQTRMRLSSIHSFDLLRIAAPQQWIINQQNQACRKQFAQLVHVEMSSWLSHWNGPHLVRLYGGAKGQQGVTGKMARQISAGYSGLLNDAVRFRMVFCDLNSVLSALDAFEFAFGDVRIVGRRNGFVASNPTQTNLTISVYVVSKDWGIWEMQFMTERLEVANWFDHDCLFKPHFAVSNSTVSWLMGLKQHCFAKDLQSLESKTVPSASHLEIESDSKWENSCDVNRLDEVFSA